MPMRRTFGITLAVLGDVRGARSPSRSKRTQPSQPVSLQKTLKRPDSSLTCGLPRNAGRPTTAPEWVAQRNAMFEPVTVARGGVFDPVAARCAWMKWQ